MQLLKVLLVVLLAVNLSAGFFFKKKKVYVHQPAPAPAPAYRYAYYPPQPAPVYHYQTYHQPPVAASGYASYYNQPRYHAAPAYAAAAPVAYSYHAATYAHSPAPATHYYHAPAPVHAPYPPSAAPASYYRAPASAPVALTPSGVSLPKPDNQNPVLTPVVVSEPTTPPPLLVPAAPVLTPLEVPKPTTPAPTLVLTNPQQKPVDVGATVISNTQALPAFGAASFQGTTGTRLGGGFEVIRSVDTELFPAVPPTALQASAQAIASAGASSVEVVPSMLVRAGKLTDSIEIIKSVGYDLPPQTLSAYEEAAIATGVSKPLTGLTPKAPLSVNRGLDQRTVDLENNKFNPESGGVFPTNIAADDISSEVDAPVPITNTASVSTIPIDEGVNIAGPGPTFDEIPVENPPVQTMDGVTFVNVQTGADGDSTNDIVPGSLDVSNPIRDETPEDLSSNNKPEENVNPEPVETSTMKEPLVVAAPLGRKPPTERLASNDEDFPPPSRAALFGDSAYDLNEPANDFLRSADTDEDSELDPLSLPEVQQFLKDLGNDQQTKEDARRKKHINLQVFKSVEIDPHVSYSRVARQ